MKALRFLIILLCLMASAQGLSAQVKDIVAVRENAENGDAQAQYLLGWCYGNGSAGLVKNYTMAAMWLEKSAKQGYEAAQYYLGWCYYYGHGVKQSNAQAAYWYGLSAKQGNQEAVSMVRHIERLAKLGVEQEIIEKAVAVNTFDPSKPPILDIISNTVQFVDPNGNNAIDADETCFIRFKVENTGAGDAIDCIAKIGTVEQTKGLVFKDIKVPSIKANEIKEIEMPISATDATMDANINLYVQVDEPHGFGTAPFSLQVDTRKFVAPLLQVVDFVASSDGGNLLKKKENFILQVLLQNTKNGTAKDVNVDISLPANVMLREPDKRSVRFSTMNGGDTKSLEYPLIVNQNYDSNEIPITLQIKEKYGKYAENKTISLKLEQELKQKIVVESNASQEQSYNKPIASLVSDVDKNIPVSKSENRNTFALIIANESYKNVDGVPFASNDGRIFSEYCKKTLGVPEKQVRLVLNATYNDIKRHIKWLGDIMEATKGEAKIIFYYAGHGIPNESDNSAYLLPIDGYSSDIESGYALKDLYAALGEHPSDFVTVFLDACFSGTKREGDMMASARGVAIKVKKTAPSGKTIVFSASQADETAYPYKGQGHGMFTYFLLKRLQETEGNVSLGDLGSYITDQVRKLSVIENEKVQTPTVIPADILKDEWKDWTLK